MDIVVCMGEGTDRDAAQSLASSLGAPLLDEPGDGLALRLDGGGLSLVGYGLEYHGDFEQMIRRIEKGRLYHEMLVHVAKPGTDRAFAIDAAAGMGEDALLLAACGYEVTMYEKNVVIAALLRDAMRRAEKNAFLCDIIGRMRLIEGDSVELMQTTDEKVDLVYLDPMFPKRKKSGLINKKLQLIQKLEQPCGDEKAMLDSAMAKHPKKIVIKRPLKGEYFAGVKPSYTVKGKAIRYDCIALP